MKLKEIDRIRRDADDIEKGLKDRTQKLEMQRIELEEEISRHKSTNASDKLQSEEVLIMAKQKMKSDEVTAKLINSRHMKPNISINREIWYDT